MRALLAIAIGPVRDFLAARKTRDLWYGSRLLSDVSRAVARSLRDHGADLIVPDGDALDQGGGIANRLLAIVPDGIAPRQIFAAGRAAAQDELAGRLDALFRALSGRGASATEEELARARARAAQLIDVPLLELQIGQVLEISGAWYPCAREEDYPTARREVARLLDGRMALHTFAQPAFRGDETASSLNDYWQRQRDALGERPKSTLDAARESVIRRDLRGEALGEVRRRFHLAPGEELDGLSLIKRRAATPCGVSTARVAIDPFIRRLKATQHGVLKQLCKQAELLETYPACPAVTRIVPGNAPGLHHYADFPFDTRLFYGAGGEEREVQAWVKDGPGSEGPKRHDLATFYRLVRDACTALDIDEPPAYYAILHAAGNMDGTAGRGSDDASREADRRQAKELAAFAGRAEAIVGAQSGVLVYGGGDDLLAFLPLDTALACADALRRAFGQLVRRAAGDSLSVGVAIVHHSEPLDDALGYARNAAKAARGPSGALAVALHARTGGTEQLTVVSPWAAAPVQRHWYPWINRHWSNELPDSAAYDLQQRLWRQLAAMPLAVETEGAERLTAPKVLVDYPLLIPQEVARIFRSKRAAGEQPLARALQHDVLERLNPANGAAGRGQTIRGARRQLQMLRQIINEMLIARRLTTVVTIARGPWEAARALPTEVTR